MSNKTFESISNDLENTLTICKLALKDLKSVQSPRRDMAIRNIIVFGRAVTNVLQNYRSVDREAFNIWYEKYKVEMEQNTLFKFLYNTRTEILKQGVLRTTSSLWIAQMDSNTDRGPKPPNAIAFFLGDPLGGSGWEIQLPDGSKEKYYIDLSQTNIQAVVNTYFVEIRDENASRTVEDICLEYVTYLDNMCKDFKNTFYEDTQDP